MACLIYSNNNIVTMPQIYQQILELNFPTGVLGPLERSIIVPFVPRMVKIAYLQKHQITGPTNTGVAYLWSDLPIKNNIGPLVSLIQGNDFVHNQSGFMMLDNWVSQTWRFWVTLSTQTAPVSLLDADIVVCLEFTD